MHLQLKTKTSWDELGQAEVKLEVVVKVEVEVIV